MLRRFVEGSFVLAVVLFVADLGAARLWRQPGDGLYWRAAALTRGAADLGPVEFVGLYRRATPNDALACPERLCQKAKADLTSPVFLVSADELRKKVAVVADAEPDTSAIPGGQFVQYSPLFRFPDIIDVSVVEAGAKASTLSIYSRSVFGYTDFGVNKQRIERWLAALQRITPTS
jgi:uncharacterized protein (DUF1499 family)